MRRLIAISMFLASIGTNALAAPPPLQTYTRVECKEFKKELDTTTKKRDALRNKRAAWAKKGDWKSINGSERDFGALEQRLKRLAPQIKQCIRDRQ